MPEHCKVNDKDNKEGEHPIFSDSLPRKLVKAKSDNLKDFHMRRLDVLDKLNQEAFLNHQK